MAARCEERFEETGDRCVFRTRHREHRTLAGQTWPNEETAALMDRPKATEVLRDRAGKAAAPDHVDPARDPIALDRPSPDVPVEAEMAWSRDAWVSQAEVAFHAFLRSRREEFTTPEHVWPLLDQPREMRALVLVVRRLVRRGLMHEVGAVRLRGVYRTRDGHEFLMNKLVPIYVSDCYQPQPETAPPSEGLLAL